MPAQMALPYPLFDYDRIKKNTGKLIKSVYSIK